MEPLVLDDDAGPAVALITWRTLYETSDYHLPWPRLLGSGVLMRPDVLPSLADAAAGNIVLRDFVVGDVIRQDEASPSGQGNPTSTFRSAVRD